MLSTVDLSAASFGWQREIDRHSPGTSTSTEHRDRRRSTECHSIGLLIWIPRTGLCCHTCTSSAPVPTNPLHLRCFQSYPLVDSEAQLRCPPCWLFTFGEQLTDNTSVSANHSASTRDLHWACTPPVIPRHSARQLLSVDSHTHRLIRCVSCIEWVMLMHY